MQGNQVFRNAVVNISEAVIAAPPTRVQLPAVDWFILTNQRILAGVAHRLDIAPERVISTVARHANTSAASIPLAWAQGTMTGASGPASFCSSKPWAAARHGAPAS